MAKRMYTASTIVVAAVLALGVIVFTVALWCLYFYWKRRLAVDTPNETTKQSDEIIIKDHEKATPVQVPLTSEQKQNKIPQRVEKKIESFLTKPVPTKETADVNSQYFMPAFLTHYSIGHISPEKSPAPSYEEFGKESAGLPAVVVNSLSIPEEKSTLPSQKDENPSNDDKHSNAVTASHSPLIDHGGNVETEVLYAEIQKSKTSFHPYEPVPAALQTKSDTCYDDPPPLPIYSESRNLMCSSPTLADATKRLNLAVPFQEVVAMNARKFDPVPAEKLSRKKRRKKSRKLNMDTGGYDSHRSSRNRGKRRILRRKAIQPPNSSRSLLPPISSIQTTEADDNAYSNYQMMSPSEFLQIHVPKPKRLKKRKRHVSKVGVAQRENDSYYSSYMPNRTNIQQSKTSTRIALEPALSAEEAVRIENIDRQSRKFLNI